MDLVDNKVVLVTGGAQGMGASHIRKLVDEGASVMISDILIDKGEALAKELGEKVKFVELDVTKRDAWDKAIKQTQEAFGPIDVLVNNTGIDIMKKFIGFTEKELQKMLEVNLFSQFHGMQAILPSMQKAGSGSIINISSLAGLRGTAGNSIYNASKFTVTYLTKAVAQEYAEFNIRVNTVHPGAIKTSGIETDDIKDVVQDYAKNIPMKRIGEAEEVSNMVAYIASDMASYSTGTGFIVDGAIMST